jgi:rare lipoprotein A
MSGIRQARSTVYKLTLVVLLIGVVSCARAPHATYFPEGSSQTGLASWYGPDFHGKRTSNKEIYDMFDMTAAHQTLPFGTSVMVTNLDNGRAATVRINDRGPFVGNRIIDLSYAAARVLGMIGPGTVRVRLDVLRDVSPSPTSVAWSVQAGSFISKDNAYALVDKLKGAGYSGVEVSIYKTPAQVYYRVLVRASDKGAAMATARRLNTDGLVVIVLEE